MQGSFIDGKIQYGNQYWNNETSYTGEFNEGGKPHGHGTMYRKGVKYYEGEMKNGTTDGKGTLFDSKGAIRYTGAVY
jgi:hypothetical protein